MTQAARPYIRMNGAGNAFIVVQAFEEGFHPTEDQVRALADKQEVAFAGGVTVMKIIGG